MVIWRDVLNFPGYRVSDDGQCVSHWRRVNHAWVIVADRPKAIKQTRNTNGYIMVRLNKDGRQRLRSLHLVMLESFCGPRPSGMEGRHLDDNKENNHLSNLAWGTKSVNMRERTLHGRDGVSKLTPYMVHKVRHLLDLGMTQKAIAIRLHLNQATISHIKTGKSWSYV
jgi:DNA-directed RNA polymerase specialized sigma54-like protein